MIYYGPQLYTSFGIRIQPRNLKLGLVKQKLNRKYLFVIGMKQGFPQVACVCVTNDKLDHFYVKSD
jgi:hypothetical protein